MEINGLRVILSEAVENGTLHAIQSPPERKTFASDADYQRTYDEWWTMTHAWTITGIT